MAGLWSVVAEAVVRACLTSIGIVRVLLRRLGLPRALCERGYRPSGRGHRRQRPAHHPGDIAAAAILLDRGWGKATQRAELAAPPLLSFLQLAQNSAYVSLCYRQSGMTRLRATGGRRIGPRAWQLDDTGMHTVTDGAHRSHPHFDVTQLATFKFADDGSTHPTHAIGTSVQWTLADDDHHDPQINFASNAKNHLL